MTCYDYPHCLVQEWASLIFVVVSLYMTVSAIFAVMFWAIVVRLSPSLPVRSRHYGGLSELQDTRQGRLIGTP